MRGRSGSVNFSRLVNRVLVHPCGAKSAKVCYDSNEEAAFVGTQALLVSPSGKRQP